MTATRRFTPEGEAALLSAIRASRAVARQYARPGRCLDDLVSAATVRLVREADRLLAHPQPIAYARVAARAAVLNHLRREARHRGTAALDGFPLPARGAGGPAPFTFDELLGLAYAGDRELLRLRFRDGLRHDEVAARLGVTRDCVSARLSRAIRRLRRRVAG